MSTKAKRNPAMIFLAVVMLINALGYGIIIPLLYPYAQQFGITPFTLSLLFTSFSIFQFFSTPIMGRLSDKYGRKPLLLLSVLGSGISFVLFASAQAVWMLFLSRILDGITGGNISVAQAVIADSTEGKDRAKSFGMLGAAFGFGFLAGPAVGGFLSRYGLSVPFWFAAGLSFLGVILGLIFLPETNPFGQRVVKKEPLFNLHAVFKALLSPTIGVILLVTFLTSTAQSAFIIGFQSFSVDILHLTSSMIGVMYTSFGVTSLLMQSMGIQWLVKMIPSKRTILKGSIVLAAISMVFLFWQSTTLGFFVTTMIYGVVFAPSIVMITSLISEGTKGEDQGAVLGLNQSYLSLGQIAGPLLAGAVATRSIPGMFLLAVGLFAISALASWHLPKPATHKVDV